jgi:hypothetical protein
VDREQLAYDADLNLYAEYDDDDDGEQEQQAERRGAGGDAAFEAALAALGTKRTVGRGEAEAITARYVEEARRRARGGAGGAAGDDGDEGPVYDDDDGGDYMDYSQKGGGGSRRDGEAGGREGAAAAAAAGRAGGAADGGAASHSSVLGAGGREPADAPPRRRRAADNDGYADDDEGDKLYDSLKPLPEIEEQRAGGSGGGWPLAHATPPHPQGQRPPRGWRPAGQARRAAAGRLGPGGPACSASCVRRRAHSTSRSTSTSPGALEPPPAPRPWQPPLRSPPSCALSAGPARIWRCVLPCPTTPVPLPAERTPALSLVTPPCPAGDTAALRDSAVEADMARIRRADALERGSSGYLAAELEAAERNPLNLSLQEEAAGDDRFPAS